MLTRKIMKNLKRLLLLTLTTSLMTLSGCNKDERTKLQYGQMISTDVSMIDYLTLKEKMDDHETFLLAVSSPTCSCWATFRGVLSEYIKNNHVIVYAIPYESFHDASGKTLDTFGLNIQSGYTSFAIVNKGELKANLKSGKDQIFKSSTSFESFMSNMVILPRIFYISLDEVDLLYKKDETSLIYFARSNCSDCSYFNKYFLDDYDVKNTMFILDCETIGIREYDEEGHLTPESQIAWNAFKQAYGLGSDNNPKYGYNTGYVPTMLLVHGGESVNYVSGAVYFNDSVSKDEDGYYISDSYYTSERLPNLQYLQNLDSSFRGLTTLKGHRLNIDEVEAYGEYYFWKQEEAAKLHDSLMNEFLKYAFSVIDFSNF